LKINEDQSLVEGKSVKIKTMDELKHAQRRAVHLGPVILGIACSNSIHHHHVSFQPWLFRSLTFSSWAAGNLTNRYDQILKKNAISQHQLEKIARLPTPSD
jgi:hypothetical protein